MLKVMIVDDEPYILQGLQFLIDWNSEGFEIDALMSNGKDALEYLSGHKIDLIISDIQMPVMNVLDLLEEINRQNLSEASLSCLPDMTSSLMFSVRSVITVWITF